MKNIFLGMMVIALMTTSAIANDGGKKKSKQKAKTECIKDKSCIPPNCDPKCCDAKACVPKQVVTTTSSKDAQISPALTSVRSK